jgi:hypothetical protein
MLTNTTDTKAYELSQMSDQGALLDNEQTNHDDYTLAYRFVKTYVF